MAKLDEKIGFIGGGNMAYAIGSGLITRGFVKADQVLVSGPHLENLERWRALGVSTTDDNYSLLLKMDIIFICVKPHILSTCTTHLRFMYAPNSKNKLFVSIVGGVTLQALDKHFDFIKNLKMTRAIPNISVQIGEVCTVYTTGWNLNQQDVEKVHIMLNSLGIAQHVPDSVIDAISGVSGCVPAYAYTIIEALADGAVEQGVPRKIALQFSAQMLMCAAKTVLLTGKHPAVLRDEVCSPGGSTIVGVRELEKGNLRATLINAVEKASQRSEELRKKEL